MADVADVGSLPVSMLIGSPVARVAPDVDLYGICDALAAGGIGALVVGDDDQVAGVVSERDIATALAARRDLATTRARDIANSPIWCDAEATVAEVAAQMMECYVRHVLVEDDGRLVGIVSARDLIGVYAAGEAETE